MASTPQGPLPPPTVPWMLPKANGTPSQVFALYMNLLDALVRQLSGINRVVPFASAPANPSLGQTSWFSDSTTNAWGAIIAGGGADKVLGIWNGTNWTVMAK